MLFRSTNSKFTHFQGDVLSNVDDSSHGVQLTGGTTGGIVQPCGDETDIALNVRSKGAGGVMVGANSSQVVRFSGTTQAFKGFYQQASTYSHAAPGVDRGVELTFASTTIDVVPGDWFAVTSFEPAAQSSALSIGWVRLSTAAASRVTINIVNEHSTAAATNSGTIRVAWADLT